MDECCARHAVEDQSRCAHNSGLCGVARFRSWLELIGAQPCNSLSLKSVCCFRSWLNRAKACNSLSLWPLCIFGHVCVPTSQPHIVSVLHSNELSFTVPKLVQVCSLLHAMSCSHHCQRFCRQSSLFIHFNCRNRNSCMWRGAGTSWSCLRYVQHCRSTL